MRTIGTDSMSVVDLRLAVHGIANVRIADASVIPSITSGKHERVLAIAERAASLISREQVDTSHGQRSLADVGALM